MDLEFLNHFEKRMKNVGAYALLFKNSNRKAMWEKCGFSELDEQTNITFAVLLYIMEQSLREQNCTLDDVGNFIDLINNRWLKKEMTYEQCRVLAEFIINTVLCDEGRAMYFKRFNFNTGEYQPIHINFVANTIVYINDEVRRTSYYLTEEGYALLLSTLEMENNMRLTVHEVIFKMHLEKAAYDQAVDEVKTIFNLLRIQLQKMQEAMRRIRQNALSYSVADYKQLLEDNLATLKKTQHEFDGYRQMVAERVADLEQRDINICKLSGKDQENLAYLKIIEQYLNRALDEHQRILNNHYDLKNLYEKELEALSEMAFIKRFNLRTEVYDKLLHQPEALANLQEFLRPLFRHPVVKRYNVNKALQYQKPIRGKKAEEDEVLLDFDPEEWQSQQRQQQEAKLKRYQTCLHVLLSAVAASGGAMALAELGRRVETEPDLLAQLMPTAEIFREVMVELLKNETIDLDAVRAERANSLLETGMDFQVNESLLTVVEGDEQLAGYRRVQAYKVADGEPVIFQNITSDNGLLKRVICSNIMIVLA